MPQEEQREASDSPRDVTAWFAGRRSEFERWVEETSRVAVSKVRGVLADEIRTLSRRVERMHALLDQLEQIVEVPFERDGAEIDEK